MEPRSPTSSAKENPEAAPDRIDVIEKTDKKLCALAEKIRKENPQIPKYEQILAA
jgi:hypothetical protein